LYKLRAKKKFNIAKQVKLDERLLSYFSNSSLDEYLKLDT